MAVAEIINKNAGSIFADADDSAGRRKLILEYADQLTRTMTKAILEASKNAGR